MILMCVLERVATLKHSVMNIFRRIYFWNMHELYAAVNLVPTQSTYLTWISAGAL